MEILLLNCAKQMIKYFSKKRIIKFKLLTATKFNKFKIIKIKNNRTRDYHINTILNLKMKIKSMKSVMIIIRLKRIMIVNKNILFHFK